MTSKMSQHPAKHFELAVAGGAALALLGRKASTLDLDVLAPEQLPSELVEAARVVAKAKGLGADWINSGVARVVKLMAQRTTIPPLL